MHAVLARSTFQSQNVQNTPCSNHFWKLGCRKSARRCGTKHISKSKCTKHTLFKPVEMSKKRTPLWREAHFKVKMLKEHPVSDHFWKLRCRKSARRCGAKHTSKSKVWGTEHCWTFRCALAWQAQGNVDLVQKSKTCGFCSISKNDGRGGTFEEDLQRCLFRGRRNTRDMFIRDVSRSGR